MKLLFRWLLTVLFIARITIPWGTKETYRDIVKIEHADHFYILTDINRRVIYLPIMWTTIEEQE